MFRCPAKDAGGKRQAEASDQVFSVVLKLEKHSGAHAIKNDMPVSVRKMFSACSVDAT